MLSMVNFFFAGWQPFGRVAAFYTSAAKFLEGTTAICVWKASNFFYCGQFYIVYKHKYLEQNLAKYIFKIARFVVIGSFKIFLASEL